MPCDIIKTTHLLNDSLEEEIKNSLYGYIYKIYLRSVYKLSEKWKKGRKSFANEYYITDYNRTLIDDCDLDRLTYTVSIELQFLNSFGDVASVKISTDITLNDEKHIVNYSSISKGYNRTKPKDVQISKKYIEDIYKQSVDGLILRMYHTKFEQYLRPTLSRYTETVEREMKSSLTIYISGGAVLKRWDGIKYNDKHPQFITVNLLYRVDNE